MKRATESRTESLLLEDPAMTSTSSLDESSKPTTRSSSRTGQDSKEQSDAGDEADTQPWDDDDSDASSSSSGAPSQGRKKHVKKNKKVYVVEPDTKTLDRTEIDSKSCVVLGSTNSPDSSSMYNKVLGDWWQRYEAARHSEKRLVSQQAIAEMVEKGVKFVSKVEDGTRGGYYVVEPQDSCQVVQRVVRALRAEVIMRTETLSEKQKRAREKRIQKDRKKADREKKKKEAAQQGEEEDSDDDDDDDKSLEVEEDNPEELDTESEDQDAQAEKPEDDPADAEEEKEMAGVPEEAWEPEKVTLPLVPAAAASPRVLPFPQAPMLPAPMFLPPAPHPPPPPAPAHSLTSMGLLPPLNPASIQWGTSDFNRTESGSLVSPDTVNATDVDRMQYAVGVSNNSASRDTNAQFQSGTAPPPPPLEAGVSVDLARVFDEVEDSMENNEDVDRKTLPPLLLRHQSSGILFGNPSEWMAEAFAGTSWVTEAFAGTTDHGVPLKPSNFNRKFSSEPDELETDSAFAPPAASYAYNQGLSSPSRRITRSRANLLEEETQAVAPPVLRRASGTYGMVELDRKPAAYVVQPQHNVSPRRVSYPRAHQPQQQYHVLPPPPPLGTRTLPRARQYQQPVRYNFERGQGVQYPVPFRHMGFPTAAAAAVSEEALSRKLMQLSKELTAETTVVTPLQKHNDELWWQILKTQPDLGNVATAADAKGSDAKKKKKTKKKAAPKRKAAKRSRASSAAPPASKKRTRTSMKAAASATSANTTTTTTSTTASEKGANGEHPSGESRVV